MSAPGDDAGGERDAPSVARALRRLREIARVLGRPVEDFLGTPRDGETDGESLPAAGNPDEEA